MSKTSQELALLLEDIKQDIIDEYEGKGIEASGFLGRTIVVQETRTGARLSIPDYGFFVMLSEDNPKGGRGPGKPPPRQSIVDWLKVKPRLALRDWSTGRFLAKTDQNYQAVAHLIQQKIAQMGTDIRLGRRPGINLTNILDKNENLYGDRVADAVFFDILNNSGW